MFYVIFQDTLPNFLKKMASSNKGRQGSLMDIPDRMPKWEDLSAEQKREIKKKYQFESEPVENNIQPEW